ncbi:MAG: glycosyltransferase [Acidobacteriota bacterium]
MTTRPRSILVVAYYFPPLGGSGALRTFNVVKGLAERGIDVGVLTTHPWTASRDDPTLVERLPPNVEIRRTHSWDLYHVRNHLRGARGGPPPSATGGAVGTSRFLSRLLRFAIVPSPTIGWRGPAVHAARRWLHERPFDLVLTTQPPITSHLVGWDLARTEGARWVAEYRDVWVDIYYDPPPSPLHAAWYRSLERRMLRRAEKVVTVGDPLARRLEERNPGVPVFVVPNGFDPDELRAALPYPLPPRSLLYLGTIVDGCERALMRLMDVLPTIDPVPRFTYVGNASKEIAGALARHAAASGLGDRYQALGFKPHHEALGYVRGATAVVVSGYPVSPFGLSGKLCEYVAAGRPVLGIVERGVVPFTDQLVDASGGATASMNDPAGLRAAVEHVLRAGAADRPILPEASRHLEWPALAARYEEVLFGRG